MDAVTDSTSHTPPSRILVVDDDLAMRRTLQGLLRDYDIAVTDCVEGALDQLDRQPCDLVLLDRRLLDRAGDVAIEHVRRRRGSVPIIMMTSREPDPQRLDRDPQRSADDVIEKPIVGEVLVSKIEHQLSARARRHHAAWPPATVAKLLEQHQREVGVARTIFDRIFARGEFDPASVRHLVLPADHLAGDVVFGAWATSERYRWMIGDVTGHTLSSALITMPLAGIFYRTAQQRWPWPMVDVIDGMERELAAMLPANMFCAAAMCELDRQAGTLEVWNGGNPDVLIRRGDGTVTRIASMGVPLGADRFAVASHETVEHPVASGDRVYAFSDGLIELRGPSREMLGFDRLLEIVSTGAAATIFGRLLDCIPDHTGAVGYDDDISLIEVVV